MYTEVDILKAIERIRKEQAFFRRPKVITVTLDELEDFERTHHVGPINFRIGSHYYTIGFRSGLCNDRIVYRGFSLKDGKRVTLSLIERDILRSISKGD